MADDNISQSPKRIPWNKGKKLGKEPEEWTRKRTASRIANGNHRVSEATKRKISESLMGRKFPPRKRTVNPWDDPEYRERMKGRRRPAPYWLGKRLSDEHRARMSAAHKKRGGSPWLLGRKASEAERRAISLRLIGNQHKKGKRQFVSESTRRKLSESRRGPKSPNWKGGITPESKRARHGVEYKLWRESVFRRDRYTCVLCGAIGRKGVGHRVLLQADHIKPFALFPDLRLDINNGRTLCIPCHKKTDTYAGRTR